MGKEQPRKVYYRQLEIMRESGYVAIREAADAAGVTILTVHRWVKAGKVSSCRVGQIRFVSIEDLARYRGKHDPDNPMVKRILALKRAALPALPT